MEARDPVRREPGVAEVVGDLRAQGWPVGDGRRTPGGAIRVALGRRDGLQPRVEAADARRDLALAEVGQRGDAPPLSWPFTPSANGSWHSRVSTASKVGRME